MEETSNTKTKKCGICLKELDNKKEVMSTVKNVIIHFIKTV